MSLSVAQQYQVYAMHCPVHKLHTNAGARQTHILKCFYSIYPYSREESHGGWDEVFNYFWALAQRLVPEMDTYQSTWSITARTGMVIELETLYSTQLSWSRCSSF